MFARWRVSWLVVFGIAVGCWLANPDGASVADAKVPANDWAANVQQALARIEQDERHALQLGQASAHTTMRGVRANLAATLALYEADDERDRQPAYRERAARHREQAEQRVRAAREMAERARAEAEHRHAEALERAERRRGELRREAARERDRREPIRDTPHPPFGAGG